VEAVHAAKGGAAIADAEFPASALGTPYPLNIFSVRNRLNTHGFRKIKVSTNIGEVQNVRAASCQAAVGVAVAGADLIKFGLASHSLDAAIYLGDSIVRSVRKLAPRGKKLYPAVFVDDDMRRFLNPFTEGPKLAAGIKADGVLIDTFNKLIGKGLMDFCSLKDIKRFVDAMHNLKKEAWIAGSITLKELPELWNTGVDVICVRGAACENDKGAGRFGQVTVKAVQALSATLD
jgi:uncharacterized protein (UPF0264 family)